MCSAAAARVASLEDSKAKSKSESESKSKSKSKSQAQSNAGVGLLASNPRPYLGAFTQASVSVLRHLAGLPPAADASAAAVRAISPSSASASANADESAHLSAAPYAFTAADELESVVHSMFTLIHPQLIRDALGEWMQRCPRSRAHAAALSAFWQQSMRAGAWRDAVDAARRVDYAACAEALCRVLPGGVFWHDGDEDEDEEDEDEDEDEDGGSRAAEWGGASEAEWAAASIAAIGEEQRALFPALFQ